MGKSTFSDLYLYSVVFELIHLWLKYNFSQLIQGDKNYLFHDVIQSQVVISLLYLIIHVYRVLLFFSFFQIFLYIF